MDNPNAPSGQPEHEFARNEVVRYSDGGLALGFQTLGDKLVLGNGSVHSQARDFGPDSPDRAIIYTHSGNAYGIGNNGVLNKNKGQLYPLPEDDIDVTIGEPCHIPGVADTTAVKSVLLRANRESIVMAGDPAHTYDTPSPFAELDRQMEAAAHQTASS